MTIETKFQDKTARVILVDSGGAVRQLLSEVAKEVGFSNAQAVASIADAHNILETEGADWLIVPLSADQPVNGMHTVRLVSSFPSLKDVRVSLLLDESEMWCLPKAFECGLLSYHIKPFTKDTLSKDLTDLLKHFENHEWDGTKTSAEYLRKSLVHLNSHSDLLQLEKRVLEMFPGNPLQLLNLATAQHLNKQDENAKATLKQASYIDAKFAAAIDAKAKELFGSTDLSLAFNDAGVTSNVLSLGKVVIVDSDDSTRAATKSVFEELGVTDIQEYLDGESAWEGIDSGEEPSLIIMEWKIPKLTGPLLIQRIRSKGYMNSPIVIQSSLLKPSDMPIVREMGVANLVEKPADRQTFLKTVIWTIQQDRLPTEQQTLELKIRIMLAMKNIGEAESLAARYFGEPTIVEGRKNVIRAEIAYAKENYQLARDYAIESLKGSGESIFALNILGKSLMVLRDFQAALKCFQKAQSLSPLNLERLVMIAESEAELEKESESAVSIAKAKDIDPESPTVQEGEIKVAIASGSSDKAKKLLGKLEGVGNVISYLNNKAVAHAKCGHMDEGIELYQKTLDAVPDERIETKAVVAYNMVLAKIRKGDLSDALVDLDDILRKPETKISKKSASLKKRLQAAVSSNTGFTLKEADHNQQANTTPAPESPTQDESLPADHNTITSSVIQTSAGDLCCYLLFKSSDEPSENLTKLLTSPPRFKQRKAIERGETFMGADANSGNKAS